MGPEKTFETKIKNYLKAEGAYFVKYFANGFTKKGIPDILACINGYFIGIEVKADSGHPSELQIHNVEEIRKSGGFAFIVYPSGFEKLKNFIEDLKNDKFTSDMPLELK